MPHHPHHKHHTLEWFFVIIIITTAIVFRFNYIKTIPPGLYPDEAMNGNNALRAIETGDYKVFYPDNNGREGLFMNIQAQSIKLFGNTPWVLRVVSGMFGVLTVLGLYLLARLLFNWEIAAIASFLMAVSFWHTLFSRIGFRAIMAPCFLVWAFYFFWRGKSSGHLWNFLMSGIFWGLGFYSYISFRAMPLALILTLAAYWYSVKKDFVHEKYSYIKAQLQRGFALLMVSAIIVILPLGYYFLTHPSDFFGRTAQVSIFAEGNALYNFAINTVKTLGMFNFIGDFNWRHNFSGAAQLIWPVGIMFLIGFIRAWYKLFKTKKTHGHFATVQVLLLSWFFVGLLPVVLSNESLPHALRAIVVIPVVFIFAGEGLWWIYDFCRKWYVQRDLHDVEIHGHRGSEGAFIATFAIILLLFSIMLSEYNKYFNLWAKNPNVADAYATKYAALGNYINSLPKGADKYVLVNTLGVLVETPGSPVSSYIQELPMPAQTVMYITDTWSFNKQKQKQIYYITEGDYMSNKRFYDSQKYFFPLEPLK